jgi:hypothetical protein
MNDFTINVKIGIKFRELCDLLKKSKCQQAEETLGHLETAKAIWAFPSVASTTKLKK